MGAQQTLKGIVLDQLPPKPLLTINWHWQITVTLVILIFLLPPALLVGAYGLSVALVSPIAYFASRPAWY